MRAIRVRAFILTPLLVAPTGRYAAGVARVPLCLSRRVSGFSRKARINPSLSIYDEQFRVPFIRQIQKIRGSFQRHARSAQRDDGCCCGDALAFVI